MGREYDAIDEHQREWIARQSLFFVGSAPLGGAGHVNVSPKGPLGTLQVVGPREVAYLDVVGSGAETIAHVRENGRIVVMLCAFQGPPRVLRLHGRGEVLLPGDDRYAGLLDGLAFAEPDAPEARRAIVRIDVDRIADSCGYGVPLMEHRGERPHTAAWAAKKLRAGGAAAIEGYKAQKNKRSIDGLPALDDPVPAPR